MTGVYEAKNVRLYEASKARRVYLYRNGSRFSRPKCVVVNDRQIRDFSTFLTRVTSGLRAPVAIRNIYTPKRGRHVYSLKHLKGEHYYVAGGSEQFKNIKYGETGLMTMPSKGRKNPEVFASQKGTTSRYNRPVEKPFSIHVFRNGDENFRGARVLLSRKIMGSWEHVLQLITYKADLITPTKRLCTLDGKIIHAVSEIQDGGKYVAIEGSRPFQKVTYSAVDATFVRSIPKAVKLKKRTKPVEKKLGDFSIAGANVSSMKASGFQLDAQNRARKKSIRPMAGRKNKEGREKAINDQKLRGDSVMESKDNNRSHSPQGSEESLHEAKSVSPPFRSSLAAASPSSPSQMVKEEALNNEVDYTASFSEGAASPHDAVSYSPRHSQDNAIHSPTVTPKPIPRQSQDSTLSHDLVISEYAHTEHKESIKNTADTQPPAIPPSESQSFWSGTPPPSEVVSATGNSPKPGSVVSKNSSAAPSKLASREKQRSTGLTPLSSAGSKGSRKKHKSSKLVKNEEATGHDSNAKLAKKESKESAAFSNSTFSTSVGLGELHSDKSVKGVFHASANSGVKSRTSEFVEEGSDGLFRAKNTRNEVVGAEVIAEGRDTETEKPIDQLEAKEVEEEEVSHELEERENKALTNNDDIQEVQDDVQEATEPAASPALTPTEDKHHSTSTTRSQSRHSIQEVAGEKPHSTSTTRSQSRHSIQEVAGEKPHSASTTRSQSRHSVQEVAGENPHSASTTRSQSRHSVQEVAGEGEREKEENNSSVESKYSHMIVLEEVQDKNAEEIDDNTEHN